MQKSISTLKRKLPLFIFLILSLSLCWILHGSLGTDDYLRTSIDLSSSENQSRDAGDPFSSASLYNIKPGEYQAKVRYSDGGSGYFTVVDADENQILAEGQLSSTSSERTEDGTQPQTTVQLSVHAYTSEIQVRIYEESGSVKADRLQFFSAQKYWKDSYWLPALLFGVLCWFYYAFQEYRKNGDAGLLILSGLTFVLALPYIGTNLSNGVDLAFHLRRIEGISEGLLSGQFPVRINQAVNSGAGYINSVMNPELLLYIPGVMCSLGASTVLAYKTLAVLTNLITGIIAYWAGKRFINQRAGLIFAVLYLLNPFRLYELYIRAGISGALSMAFIPLALYGIWELIQGDYRQGFWHTLIGMTGVFQSHIINTLILMLFVIPAYLYYIIRYHAEYFRDRKRLRYLLYCIGSFFAVNLWFIYPFLQCYSLYDMNINHHVGMLGISSITTESLFILKDQVLSSAAGPYQSVGVYSVFLALVFLLVLISGKPSMNQDDFRKGKTCFFIGTISLLLTLDVIPWDYLQSQYLAINFLSSIEFSWRFLAVSSVALSMLDGIVINYLIQNGRHGLVSLSEILIILTVIVGLNHTREFGDYCSDGNQYVSLYPYTDNLYLYHGDDNRSSDGTPRKNEMTDITQYVQEGISASAGKVEISGLHKSGTNLSFSFQSDTEMKSLELSMPLYGYQNFYRATVNGQPAGLSVNEDTHMLRIAVPDSMRAGNVSVHYQCPAVYRISDLISIASLIGLILLGYKKKREC